MVDIVSYRLYVAKNGNWFRFNIGHNLGCPKLESLLREFRSATTNGKYVKIAYVRKNRKTIFKDFMDVCEKTIERMKEFKEEQKAS